LKATLDQSASAVQNHRPCSKSLAENGKTFEQLLFIVAQRESGVEIDPYEVKNSSLDLSLYVGEYHASGMWRGVMGGGVRAVSI
jgi:hypothetical protein